MALTARGMRKPHIKFQKAKKKEEARPARALLGVTLMDCKCRHTQEGGQGVSMAVC